ncbi:MAG: hypothetical protein JW976_10055 [Syntrophaceae bacterium]|nr:hypothetical protein [Syntrophaceae bacterium]
MNKARYTKFFIFILLSWTLFFAACPVALASGLFGAPQTVSREEGDLNTAIGYTYHEDIYENGTGFKIRQNEIYSQAAYGAKNIWEIYARLGLSDLKIGDAFRENEKFFTTLGAKVFYPVSSTWGVGAFVQGTYYWSDFTDKILRKKEIKFKNLWDINCGIGFQITLPCKTKLYAGPYVYYSTAQMSLSSNVRELEYAAGNHTVENKSIVGGFAGVDVPLVKGFRLNMEGQLSERFSAGAAISYTY